MNQNSNTTTYTITGDKYVFDVSCGLDVSVLPSVATIIAYYTAKGPGIYAEEFYTVEVKKLAEEN